MSLDLIIKVVLFLFFIGIALPWSMELCARAITAGKLKAHREHITHLKKMEVEHGKEETQ